MGRYLRVILNSSESPITAKPIMASANGIPPTATMKTASAIQGTETPTRARVSLGGRGGKSIGRDLNVRRVSDARAARWLVQTLPGRAYPGAGPDRGRLGQTLTRCGRRIGDGGPRTPPATPGRPRA